jgi:carbonic anhydrase
VAFTEADDELPVAQAPAVRVAAPEIAGSLPHAAE